MANRLTRIIGGNGTDEQSFTLDPGLLQYVQSVYVEIDNSGGGDIQPTLTVATNTGTALAKKQQGRSIPAGDTGSATWALRLDDEQVVDTLGLHWGVNTDTSALGLELDTISAVRVNAGQGVTLDGSPDGTSTSNQLVLEASTLGIAQRLMARILQGTFAVVRGVGDVLTMRIGDTGDVDFFARNLFVSDTASNGLFAIVSGTGVGTGVQVTLRNGSQFIVFDHLGAPMVTYTG